MVRRLFVMIAIVLGIPTLAWAQAPQPGTYDVEWSVLHVPVSSDLPDLQTGTTTLQLEAAAGGVCPPTSAFVVRNAPASTVEGGSTTWCILSDGTFDTSSNTNGDGTWNQYTPDVAWIVAQNRRGNDAVQGVARLVTTQPPPPPPSTLKVFITQPRSNETVGGTAWVVMWVEGTSGSSNVFTLNADGRQVGTQTTSSRGPVSMPWDTRGFVNGAHTLTANVRDAAGNTGTVSITVLVRN